VSKARTDCQLLSAHLDGDAGAFEELAGRHAAMVLGTCRRLLGSGPDAEDAAQAVFVVLVRKARRLADGGGDLGGWLHRTAGMVSCTALRARRNRTRREREASMTREHDRSAEAWSRLEGDLDAALDSLPSNYRDVLVLRYFEGLSGAETAQRLAVPESTVSTRASRALERLRAKLGARGKGLGAAALGALIAEQALAAPADPFIPSVVAAAKGAAASAPILALAEGVLNMMFWTKVKIAALWALAAGLLAVATPLAVGALSGERRDATNPAAAAPVANEAKPVAGLKLTLSLVPEKIACADACAAKAGGRWNKCAACIGRTPYGGKCWSCSLNAGTCEVCGKKVPADRVSLREVKAGENYRLALTLENVSKEKLRICDYLIGWRKVKLELTGPAADSVKKMPTGVDFCLAAIEEKNFPALAPGEKRAYWIRLTGNPPGINQGSVKTCLLKPGAYKLVVVYINDVDSYFDHRTRKNVKMAGTWKNTVKSQVLELKVTGTVKPPPAGGPRVIHAW
jgi:RNA polymerase sigma factor (sigma-70 family)